eukprot:Skav217762  [mRNA]  locus=scaffold1912:7727:12536:- [translate_table: standard]
MLARCSQIVQLKLRKWPQTPPGGVRSAVTREDSIILTLGCGKFRLNKLDLGTLGGLPRLLDVGQCNDAYGAVVIATKLAEALGCALEAKRGGRRRPRPSVALCGVVVRTEGAAPVGTDVDSAEDGGGGSFDVAALAAEVARSTMDSLVIFVVKKFATLGILTLGIFRHSLGILRQPRFGWLLKQQRLVEAPKGRNGIPGRHPEAIRETSLI